MARASDEGGSGRRRAALRDFAGAHRLFLILLALGVALRTIVFFAYQPALFSPDSEFYLLSSRTFAPPLQRPYGYSAFLALVPPGRWLALVPFLQHLFGLAMACLLYAVLLRLGARRWIAALAAAPVLLDAYELNIEQYVLSETLFELLLVGGVAALLWHRPLGTRAAGLAGLLFALSALTRGTALFVALPALLAVVFLTAGLPARERLHRAGAFVLVLGGLLLGYVAAFRAVHGEWSFTGYEGRRLYARVVLWVDCSKFSVPEVERPLCPRQPVGERPRLVNLIWLPGSPVGDVDPPPGETRNSVAGAFARRAMRQQPLTYARVVAEDFATSFAPTKGDRERSGYLVAQWQFQTRFPIPRHLKGWSVRPPPEFRNGDDGRVQVSLASFLRTYQRFGYAPGPLLAAALLVGIAAALGLAGSRPAGLRSAAFLFVGLALGLCLGTLLVAPFSWRYQLPQLILLPPAAAVAATALLRRRDERSAIVGEHAGVAQLARASAFQAEGRGFESRRPLH